MTIWTENGEYCARYKNNWTLDHSPSRAKLNLTQGTLANKITKIQNKLSQISEDGIWSLLEDPLIAPASKMVTETFHSFLELVVSEGAALYHHLAHKSEFGEYIEKLNDLEAGSTITIETDNALIPWEILYPLPFNEAWPSDKKKEKQVQASLLWGHKFLIEHIVFPPINKSSGPAPLQAHRSGKSFVSLNVNPTIDKTFENRPYKPVMAHKQFYEADLQKDRLGEFRASGVEIKRMFLSGSDATIIYLFCHGKSDDPFGNDTGEQLQLDEGDYIEPGFFDDGECREFLRGPIVVLNSCSSGVNAPLSFSTFSEKFMDRRALGVLGTTLPMPATFAAAFGLKLLRRYLKDAPKPTIGTVLQRLRQELLTEENPLGLFYQLQCYLHIMRPD